jgi:signal recognition particle receptor subunit alpha
MLDHFTIFNRGGIVLWERTWEKLKGNPINHLIQTIFLEERSATDSFNYDNYGLKWERANEQGLYFVAVYQNILQKNPILDTLIGRVKATFLESYGEKLKKFSYPIPEFNYDKQFQQILTEVFAFVSPSASLLISLSFCFIACSFSCLVI